jgi:hypothetical protein
VAARPALSLASIRRSRSDTPIRTLLYGVEGIGKTTFAASAPHPIFAGPEDGAGLLDIERFQPEDWSRLREFIALLTRESHEYGTLVLDTLDWLEPLLWQHICARDGKKDVEEYGYGKGYVAAVDEWRVLVNDLERLRATKRMQIILLAHCWIKPFKNPEGDDFDRYELKVHAKAAGLLKEWSDAVLFANYETFAQKDSKTKRVRGVSTGARLCYTTRTAAYDAKNRFSLPESFALDWAEYEAAVKVHQPADTSAFIDEITRKAAELGGTIQAQTTTLLGQHAADAAMLAKINNRLNAKLAEKGN